MNQSNLTELLFGLGIFLSLIYFSVAFEKCTEGGGRMPDRFVLKGCHKPPCKIHDGDKLEVELKFKAPHASKKLTFHVDGYKWMSHLPLELPGHVRNACSSIKNGDGCPLEEGEDVHIVKEFEAEGISMDIDATVEISLRNDREKNMICVKFPVVLASNRRRHNEL